MSDTITYPPGISEKLQEFPELKHLVITDLSDIQKTSKVGEGSLKANLMRSTILLILQ